MEPLGAVLWEADQIQARIAPLHAINEAAYAVAVFQDLQAGSWMH